MFSQGSIPQIDVILRILCYKNVSVSSEHKIFILQNVWIVEAKSPQTPSSGDLQ